MQFVLRGLCTFLLSGTTLVGFGQSTEVMDQLVRVMVMQDFDDTNAAQIIPCPNIDTIDANSHITKRKAVSGDSSLILCSVLRTARNFEMDGDLKQALFMYEQALKILERQGLDKQMGAVWIRMGSVYKKLAQYDISIKAYGKALRSSEARADSLAQSVVHLEMARLYLQLQDSAKTYELLTKSGQLTPEAHRQTWKPLFRILRGIALLHHGRPDASRLLLDSALNKCDTKCPKSMEILANLYLGKCLAETANVQLSEKHFREALRLSQLTRNRYYQAEALLGIAELRLHHQQIGDAKHMLNECLAICQKDGYNEILLNVYHALIDISSQEEDLNKIAEYQRLYIDQRTLIYGETQLVNISSNLAEFETREDQYLLEDQTALMALQTFMIAEKRKINFGIAGVVVLLLIILVIFNRINKQKKRFNQTLNKLVHARTQELEDKQLELQKMSTTLRFEMDLMQQQMQSELLTLEGILYIAEKDQSNTISEDQLRELKVVIDELKAQISTIKDLNSAQSIRNEAEPFRDS